MEKYQRVPWKNFPPAVANDKMGSLRFDSKDVEAPEYDGAKRKGSASDAIDLIRRKLSPEKTAELENFLKKEKVDFAKLVILPVDALEGEGKNKIPLAIAKVLSERLGGVFVDTEIKQADKVSRTGQGINHRLAFMPTFVGKVEDKEFLIVDDTLRVGGTIANLRGYIDHNGGKTAGVFVMQSDEQSLTLQPSEKTYNKLYRKHNREKVDDFCRKEFGFDSTCLTRGEAGNIAAAASLDDMERRISDAREDGRRNGRKIAEIKADVEVGRRNIERIREKRSKAIDSGRDR